jgi:hypothetical protein
MLLVSVSISFCRLRKQALGALISEKRALTGCGEVVAGWLARLQDGCALDALYDWGDDEEEWEEEEEEEEEEQQRRPAPVGRRR